MLLGSGTDDGAGNKCGWAAEYDEVSLQLFLSKLDRKTIYDTQNNVIDFAPSQTWEARAKKVAQILG